MRTSFSLPLLPSSCLFQFALQDALQDSFRKNSPSNSSNLGQVPTVYSHNSMCIPLSPHKSYWTRILGHSHKTVGRSKPGTIAFISISLAIGAMPLIIGDHYMFTEWLISVSLWTLHSDLFRISQELLCQAGFPHLFFFSNKILPTALSPTWWTMDGIKYR